MSAYPTTKCGRCDAPIVWARTVNGKAMPVDVQPRADGNVELERTGNTVTARVLTKDELSSASLFGAQRYVAHFVTCPGFTKATARATDPQTSHEAAASVTPNLRESQAAVLDLLRRYGPMTDVELIAAARRDDVRLSDSGIRTRRHELEAMGLVKRAGTVKLGNRSHTRWAAS